MLSSIWPKPQITNPTEPISPKMVASNTGCSRLMRCQSEVTMIPVIVATAVANKIGMKTSVGCAAPFALRNAKMLVGMMVSPLVFSTRNIIIGFVAVSFFVLSSCICAIAFSPVGVAALSSPSILEAMFIKIEPITGWFLGISGNSLVKTGLSSRANTFTMPAFSPIFIMPSHRASTPVSPSDTSNAVFDESKVASTIF